MHHGKHYRSAVETLDRAKAYKAEEALQFIKDYPLAKFDESIELHVRLNIDPKKGEQHMRATVELPHGTGRAQKVAVITSTKVSEAESAQADLVGGEDLIADIKSAKIVAGVDFDVVVATPEMMPKLAQVAKILGPKGLMPNPKNETVTQKITETVTALKKGGKVSFKNDDGGNLHVSLGKRSFETAQLFENYRTIIDALHKAKPEAVKGKLIERITLCSTMGPGISVAQ